MLDTLRYLCGALRVVSVSLIAATALAACGHGSSNALLPSGAQSATRNGRQTQAVSSGDVIAISVGGQGSGAFVADTDGQGGTQTSVSDTIDVSAANAAPAAIYQTQRYGPMTYTIPKLTAGTSYTVRLHFAETWWGLGGRPGAGHRAFNVAINGAQVLTNFDVFTTAGGPDKAVVSDFSTAADGNGAITIALTNGSADFAMLNGIEIISSASAGAAAATVGGETPHSSDAFVDSTGVNVHLSEYGTLYGNNFSAIASLLQNAGLRHIRDGVTANNAQICNQDASLPSRGVHIDVLATWNQTDLQSFLTCLGSAVESLEGINEDDITGDPNWAAAVRANTQTVAAQFPQLPLVAPSLTSAGAFATLGSLSSVVAFGNAHAYFAGRNPGTGGWGGTDAFGTYGSLTWNLGVASQVSGSKPVYITEGGYSDQLDQYAVPPVTKARYSVRMFLNNFNAGVPRTYLYELVDESGPPFSHYGIVDASGNPKPVYTAIASLLGHLADPGGSFSPSPLNYALNAPSTVLHTLLQKRDGTYELIVWNEVSEWDPDANAPQSTTPQNVQVTFGRAPASIQQTTFNDSGGVSSSPVATGSSISVSAGAWPTILDIKP
jgi:hypothetical protein